MEEQALAHNVHVIGASQLHMQWGVTLSSLLGKIEQVMAIGLSRHREQALDELAPDGGDSSLQRHLRSTSRSNWAKDRSTLSVSRPNTSGIRSCGRCATEWARRLGCNLYLCELKAAFTASATVVMTTLYR
jgi:hypothetical protein